MWRSETDVRYSVWINHHEALAVTGFTLRCHVLDWAWHFSAPRAPSCVSSPRSLHRVCTPHLWSEKMQYILNNNRKCWRNRNNGKTRSKTWVKKRCKKLWREHQRTCFLIPSAVEESVFIFSVFLPWHSSLFALQRSKHKWFVAMQNCPELERLCKC